MKKLLVLIFISSMTTSFAEENSAVKAKYSQGKKIDFEALLVEGENKNAELSVVTGNLGDKDLGLLRLREDFRDSIIDDAGEEIK